LSDDYSHISQPTIFPLEPHFQDNLSVDSHEGLHQSFKGSSTSDDSTVKHRASTNSGNLESSNEKTFEAAGSAFNSLSFDDKKDLG
jgi:hypothetical protein